MVILSALDSKYLTLKIFCINNKRLGLNPNHKLKWNHWKTCMCKCQKKKLNIWIADTLLVYYAFLNSIVFLLALTFPFPVFIYFLLLFFYNSDITCFCFFRPPPGSSVADPGHSLLISFSGSYCACAMQRHSMQM